MKATPKITLTAWAQLQYSPPPTLPTLRAWVRHGLIVPAPQKVGRAWMVHPDAEYVTPTKPAAEKPDEISPRARAILGGQNGAYR